MEGDQSIRKLERRVIAGLNRVRQAATMLIDADMIIVWISDGIGSLLGYDAEELVGTSALALVHPEEVSTVASMVAISNNEKDEGQPQSNAQRYVIDLRLRNSSGEWTTVSVHAVSALADPEVRGIVIHVCQPDGYRELFQGIRFLAEDSPLDVALSSLLSAISHGGPDRTVALVVHESGRVIATTDHCPALVGSSVAEGLGSWASERSTFSLPIDAAHELIIVGSTPSTQFVDLANGEHVAKTAGLVIAAYRDRQQLQEMAWMDELTGVANRRRFNEHLAATSSLIEPITLVVVDIDQFKSVNGSYGHAIGDTVLVEIAKILSSSLRHNDVVARVGGDEFAILLRGDIGEDSQVLRRLRRRMSSIQISTAQGMVNITASVGVAPRRSGDVTAMLQAADSRLGEEKARRGKTGGLNRLAAPPSEAHQRFGSSSRQ